MVIWVTSLIEETRHAYAHQSHDESLQANGYGHHQWNLTDIHQANISVPQGLLADEIENSCRRESVIGQILQRVSFRSVKGTTYLFVSHGFASWFIHITFDGVEPSLRVAHKLQKQICIFRSAKKPFAAGKLHILRNRH